MPTEEYKTKRERKIRDHLDRLRVLVRRQPLQEFLALLSGFNWPGSRAYDALKEYTRDQDDENKKYKVFIPSLAKFAILNSNDHAGESNRNFELVFRDFRECINLIIEIKDWLPFELFEDPEYAYKAWMFLMANQQYSYQEWPINNFGRFLLLYKIVPNEINIDIDLSRCFSEKFDLTIDRFFLITQMTLVNYRGGWTPSNVFKGTNEEPYHFTEQELQKYFSSMSLSYQEFKSLALNPDRSLIGSSTQFYGYTPFDSHPIIFNNNGELIISPYYLARRMTHSIYYDLIEYFQEGENPRNNVFSSEFGKIFEKYVGKQLRYLNDGGIITPEFTYNRDKKFADWSIKYNNSLLVIEVKKTMIKQKSKFILDKEELLLSLENGVILGLKQCFRKIEHLKNNVAGLEIFSDCDTYYPIVVTFDDTYLLNDVFIRNIIDVKLKTDGISFDKPWQILTIRELENVVSVCNSDLSFQSILEEKINSAELITQEWFVFLKSKGLNFDENPLIQEVIKEEFDIINNGT